MWLIKQTINLENRIVERGENVSRALMVVGDRQAHTWQVTVMNNGEAYDISDCDVYANFVRQDGATVVAECDVSGNTASVVLPQECYAVRGPMRGIFRIHRGDVLVTASVVNFIVQEGPTNVVVDPGDIVPDISDIIAEYQDMQDAVSAATAAAAAATAAAENGVRTDTAAQGLTDTQKSNARTNIAAAAATDLGTVQTGLASLQSELHGNTVVSGVTESEGTVTVTRKDGSTTTFVIPQGLAFDGGYVDTSDNTLHLTMNGEDIEDFEPIELPVGGPASVDYDAAYYLHFYDADSNEMYGGPFLIEGGGGGGGGGTTSAITLTNITKPSTVRNGGSAVFSFTATSSDDTDVTVTWLVNGTQRATTTAISGNGHTFNAGPYLTESSSNTVRAQIVNEGGGSLNRSWTVTSTPFSISWGVSIDPIMLYTSEEDVYLVINVAAQARTENTLTLTVNGHTKSLAVTGSRSVTMSLDAAWFDTGANLVTASLASSDTPPETADPISMNVVWAYGATDPIVAFSSGSVTGVQYDTIPIYYYVYDPNSETANATLQVGSEATRAITVGREMQTYRYVPQTYGTFTTTLTCGTENTTMSVIVTQNPYNIAIVTGDNLRYNLDPNGHSNADADRASFGGMTMSAGFDWVNGGFQQDEDGATAFVVKKGHTATLPRSLFADSDSNGKTIDISFRIVNADQYDATALSDFNNGSRIGLSLKANEGELRFNSVTGQVFRYCEESRIDLSILVEDPISQRVATIWLDGIPSKVEKYEAGMLTQSENAAVIGSQHCDVWIYAIRCYNSKLSDQDMIQNYIASGSTTDEKILRCQENDIFDDNGKITPATLHAAMPNLTIVQIAAERMTESKSDPVPADITITDGATVLTLPKATSATSNDGAVFKVQGTSSVAYGRSALNMDLDFKRTGLTYKLSENAIPVNYLNIKVNVASSENANNVCAVDWYNTFQPFIIEARQNNPSIRDTVEGKPCAVFFTNTGSSAVWISSQYVQPNETVLYIMGDLCNSKKNTAVFGQDGTGTHYTKACIEISGNDTAAQRFESAAAVYNASKGEWQTTAIVDGETVTTKEYEWRMEPSAADLSDVVAAWDNAVAWVVSTIGNTAKFKNEFANYFTVDSMLYHFLMIEFFAAYDDVSKNTFYSYDYDEDAGGYRWNIKEAYDWDTIIACDNDGYPLGDYGIDYGDTDGAKSYFNAVTNTIWVNIKAAYQSELSAMYTTLRSLGAWDSNAVVEKWNDYQAIRPHAAMVRDAYIKYIYPYKTTGVVIGTSTYGYDDNYLGRLQGSKVYQRKQFFTYQTDYMDGKYGYYSKTNSMQFRTNGNAGTKDFTVKAYAKTYVTMIVDNNIGGSQKVQAGDTVTFQNVSVGSNTTLYVTPDRLVQYVRPLNETQNSTFAASGASKLMEAVLGGAVNNTAWSSGTGVSIPSAILKDLSIRNLVNFSSSLNLTPNVELETLDTRGTNAGVITLPPYAPLTSVQLNECTGIIARYLTQVATFTMESGDNLSTIWVEGCNSLIINSMTDYLLDAFTSGSLATKSARLINVNWTLDDTALLNYLLTARAIDATGEIGEAPCVLTGHVTVPVARSIEMERYNAAWPGVVTSTSPVIQQYAVTFVDYDGSTLFVEYIDSGDSAYDPITHGDISTPTRASDAQYIYTFSDWDNIPAYVIQNVTVTAQYSTTTRTYTVSWYNGIGAGNGTLIESVVTNYGQNVNPTVAIPTYTGMEGNNIFYVFNGWDKSTGFIAEDTVVKATWVIGTLPSPTANIRLKDMNIAQIYAIAKNKLAATYWDPDTYYEYTDIQVGRDFSFSNVESEVLCQNHYFGGAAENVIDTGISLFDENQGNFTLAIDYEFTRASSGATLASCFESSGSRGFRLYYNGSTTSNYPTCQWSDKTLTVGFGLQRGIMVIRHRKGERALYIYSNNPGNGVYNNAITIGGQSATRSVDISDTLTFGGVKVGNSYDSLGTGWIHWCKIWYEDIGTDMAQQIAYWPHETWRMEYINAGRYTLAGEEVTEKCAASFIANAPLALRHNMNSTNTNAGGWRDSAMRTFVNGMCYNALPQCWQAIIQSVKIRASAGNQSTEILTTEDKIYLHSLTELAGTETEPYASEASGDAGGRIAWFSTNVSRIKFCGIIIPEDAQTITSQSDPTMLPELYTISEGDVWINSGNSSIGYIYVSAENAAKHGFIGGRLTADSSNITAEDGGLWVCAYNWWERSPSVSYSTYFIYVGTNGSTNTGGNGNATYAYGVVLGFSI